MIYAASSVSLAMTEYLSIKGSQVLASKWALITYSITGSIPTINRYSLPPGWDARPHQLNTQTVGRQWAAAQTSVCLKVPSARLLISAYPREHNLLINPLHPNLLKHVKVKASEDLKFHLNEWSGVTTK